MMRAGAMHRLEYHDRAKNSHKFYELALGFRFPEGEGLPVDEVRIYSVSRINAISQSCYRLEHRGADRPAVLRLWVQEIAKVFELEIWRDGLTRQMIDALLACRFEVTPLGIHGRVGAHGRPTRIAATVADMNHPWIACMSACNIVNTKRREKLHGGYRSTLTDAGTAAEVPELSRSEGVRLSNLNLSDLVDPTKQRAEDLAALAEAVKLTLPAGDRALMF